MPEQLLHVPPEMIYQFIRTPFTQKGMIKWNKNLSSEHIFSSPLYILALNVMETIYSNNNILPLNSRGEIPTEIVRELFSTFSKIMNITPFSLDEITEPNWELLHIVHHVLRLSKLLVKSEKGEILAPSAIKLLKRQDDVKLFYRLLKTYVLKVRWAYFDEQKDEVLGQSGFLMLLYLLKVKGDQFIPVSFYIHNYLELLFPNLLEEVDQGKISLQELMQIIFNRFFLRFANWFGFVKFGPGGEPFLEDFSLTCKKTPFLDEILEIS